MCDKCKSERILTFNAKCSDMFSMQHNGVSGFGYVPTNLGVSNMCTINQRKVKSPKIGYKVCILENPYAINDEPDKVISFYKHTLWQKGINKSKNIDTSYQFIRIPSAYSDPEQIGFHAFKYLKDAKNFTKLAKLAQFHPCLVVIRVILTGNVRSGNNQITSPVDNYDPCYIANTAKWDGKIVKSF